MGLEFRVITGSPTPIYRQVIDQVRHAVAAGTILPGTQLPSVRALSEQLIINPNTVAKAYAELVHDGLVESSQGRGYFVAERREVYSRLECTRRLDQALDAFLSAVFVLNFTTSEIQDALEKRLARLDMGKVSRRAKPNE